MMTPLIFLIVLSILIFVHELGHFIAARRSGVKVEEFGLGFPPRIWSRKRGDTVYSINALPIGGFVRLYGEEHSVEADKTQAYYHKGRLARTAIVVSGVLMNFLLAVFAFAAITWFVGVPRDLGHVKVLSVSENSPASQAGLLTDDTVVAVAGQNVVQTKEFIESVNNRRGKETELVVRRGSEEVKLKVTPRENPPQGQGALGVGITSSEIYNPPLAERPFVSLFEGFKQATFWVKATVLGITDSLAKVFGGKAPEGLAGPIGIYQITEIAAGQGILALLSFIAILSVNLAVLNILPIPALDGGRLLFIGVEALFGRRVLPTFEKYAHRVGMLILLALIFLITLGDIKRLFSGGFNF